MWHKKWLYFEILLVIINGTVRHFSYNLKKEIWYNHISSINLHFIWPYRPITINVTFDISQLLVYPYFVNLPSPLMGQIS